MLDGGYRCVPDAWREILKMPITAEELKAAVFKGDRKKSPGRDGVGLDFFKVLREDIAGDMRTLFTQMLRDRQLSERQKQEDIVCIPKNARPHTPEEYRPITLLNTDYKISARLNVARVRPILAELLHPSQYCSVPGNTIFDAVATVRDAIVYAETTWRPLCVLSPDFKHAFDRISHTYLLTVLRSYGFGAGFIECIRMMYRNATSVIQVNGHISTSIAIQCGVRQGCPLSMIHFVLCLNPLLYHLDERLQGIRTHGTQLKTAVIAYADDVSIFLTSEEDVRTVRDAIACYEKATGATLNVAKSSALAVGTWDTACDITGIPFSEEIKILGVKMRKTVKQSALASWTRLTSLERTQARGAYSRDLNIAQRITYVQVYMLANLWYTAPVLQPPPPVCASGKLHWPSRGIYGGAPFSSATINTAEAKGGRWLGSD